MSSKHSRSQVASRKADDFRLINGLPKSAKAKLHAAGILTFDQLAAMSPHEIIAAIDQSDSADAETSAEHVIREDWIGQASKLAESRKTATAASTDPLLEPSLTQSANSASERVTSFALELKLSPENAVSQTRVLHVESTEKDGEKKWPGWNEAELLSFITRRAGIAQPMKSEEPAPVTTASLAAPSVEERLRQLHAKADSPAFGAIPSLPQPTRTQTPETVSTGDLPKSELEVSAKGMDLPSGVVPNGEAYNVKVMLNPAVIQSLESSPLNYTVTVYAKALEGVGKKQSALIGQSQGVISATDNLIFDVEGAVLEPGAYRLQAAASFSAPATKKTARRNFTTVIEGGLLQVY